MPRDINNEIVVAVFAVAILAFALIAALLLSNPITETEETPSMASTEVADERNISSATVTDVPQTETSSPTPRLTLTTRLEVVTATTEAATVTNAPSETATVSQTPTATQTIAFTPTPTQTSTSTPTPTATNSPTATNTNTPTATATPMTLPTRDNRTPVASPTLIPADAPVNEPANCERPFSWTTITLPADTPLYALALATNTDLDELLRVNCLSQVDAIPIGRELFVMEAPSQTIPRLPIIMNSESVETIGCTMTDVQITIPAAQRELSDIVTIFGTAQGRNFDYYVVDIRPEFAEQYVRINQSDEPVTDGILAILNTNFFGSGLHWIRLSVVNRVGSLASASTCEIPVMFE